MTHTLSFKVDGLNGREASVSVNLKDDVNILFGSNGCGKTSILRIIDSALLNDATPLSRTRFDSAEIRIRSIAFKRNFTIKYQKTSSGMSRASKKDSIKRDINSELVQISLESASSASWKTTPAVVDGIERSKRNWKHTYLPTNRIYAADGLFTDYLTRNIRRGLASRPPILEDEVDVGFSHTLQAMWTKHYGEIISKVRTIQQEALQNIFIEVLSLDYSVPKKIEENNTVKYFDPDRAFERMSSFLLRQDNKKIREALGSKDIFAKRFVENASLRNIVAVIDNVEAQIEREMRPIQELSKLVQRLFSKGKNVSFIGPRILVETEDKAEIGLECLSSGEKNLIRILFAAIVAGENTLLIDEPELSLHIDWQRELVQNIKILNPACQLILATHSPEIMADVRDESIFRI